MKATKRGYIGFVSCLQALYSVIGLLVFIGLKKDYVGFRVNKQYPRGFRFWDPTGFYKCKDFRLSLR